MDVAVRNAAEEDMRPVFELANDPDVRRFSCTGGGILWDDHVGWFRRRIADEACLFLVIEAGGAFAGQIRFDVDGDEAVVSIGLHAQWRGKGVARPALAGALSLLKGRFPEVRRVAAFIKPVNEASLRFFQECGFCPVGVTRVRECEVRRYEYAV